jgi:hypothetical protein
MSGNCELGRGLRRREKNATAGGAGRFEKPAPDARAAPSEAHESLISRKTVAVVPLTGLSFRFLQQSPFERLKGPDACDAARRGCDDALNDRIQGRR